MNGRGDKMGRRPREASDKRTEYEPAEFDPKLARIFPETFKHICFIIDLGMIVLGVTMAIGGAILLGVFR